jgi:hypothetical protein
MYPTYQPGLSIERVDNSGPYSPENCCWATHAEQQRNQRTNRLITHNGRTMTATDWAKETGIKYPNLISRLNAGWSAERALTPKDARMFKF